MQEKALGVAYPISDFSHPGDWVLDNAVKWLLWDGQLMQLMILGLLSSGIASTSGGNYLEFIMETYNEDPAPSNSTFTCNNSNSIDIPTLTGGTTE